VSPLDLLPGLWVGLLGASLAAVLRRWFDPVPWRILAAFAAVLLLLFAPVLLGGKVLLPLDNLRGQVPFQRLAPAAPHGNFLQGDLIQLVTPSLAAIRTAWTAGRWPLWNARVGAGMPLLADPQAQALQPLVLLGYPLSLPRAAGATAAMRVLTALVFGFLWLRRQGLTQAPALAGSLAYGLGGFLLLWLGWPIANSAALLPLALYALARCDEIGGRRDAALLALAMLALLLGGHPETVLYALGLVLVFLFDKVRRRPRGQRQVLLARTGAALAVAGMVAAPVLLPAVEYAPKTMRAARLGPSPPRPSSPAPSLPPSPGEEGEQQEQSAVKAPSLPVRGGGRGRERGGWGSEGRAGEASFTDALARRWLPIAAPNAHGNNRFIHYWGFSNINEDASGFVGTASLMTALMAVGVRRRFPQERLALGIAALCLVLLAPLGLSSRLFLPLSLCLSYLAACTLERFRMGEVRRRSVLIAALGLGILLLWGYLVVGDPGDSRLEVFRLGWLRWQLRFLILAALVLVIAASWRRRGRSLAVVGVAAVVAAELLLIHRPANPPMPRRLTLPVTGPVRFLQAEPGYRMAALGRALPPNLASLYGLTDARIYNPVAPQAYVTATAPITVAWHGEQPELGKPGHPLYPRLGVRYLLAAPDAALPPPLQRVYADPDASVWGVPGAQPRLYLSGPVGLLQIPRLEDSWITARGRAEPAQRLGSSLYQDGGWRLLLDRRSHPTAMSEGAFLAAPLPAGRWRLDLLYRPRGFLWGCVLAAFGLAAGAAAFVPPPGKLLSATYGSRRSTGLTVFLRSRRLSISTKTEKPMAK
jgi:hypothetical protein